MFENISGLSDINAEQKLKIAIVGEPGAGKTWLALTAPGPIFHCDFDGRYESVKEFIRKSRRTDIASKLYQDLDPNMPKAMQALETDIAMFEYGKQQKKEIPATYILDSATFLRAACEHELIKQHPAMCRKIRMGTKEIKIPSGWDIINGNRGYMEYIIGRISELGNVIMVFHEQDEKDAQASTKEEKKYTGRKTIQPQYLSTLLSLFNDRFRVTLDYKGKRLVQTQPSSDFLAISSMALAEIEQPDIQAMIKKHQAQP